MNSYEESSYAANTTNESELGSTTTLAPTGASQVEPATVNHNESSQQDNSAQQEQTATKEKADNQQKEETKDDTALLQETPEALSKAEQSKDKEKTARRRVKKLFN